MPVNYAGATVLVVEDDALTRMFAADIFGEAGFQVLEAGNADDALTMLDRHKGIGLLFSDIDMPGTINGLELAHQVHRLWPPVKLLLTSGHHHLQPGSLPDDGQFIRKPWNHHALMHTVSQVMQG